MFTAALCVIAPNWKLKCPSPGEQLIYGDKKQIIGCLGTMDRGKIVMGLQTGMKKCECILS